MSVIPSPPAGPKGTGGDLTAIPEAPIGTAPEIRCVYVDPRVAAMAPSTDPSTVALCRAMESARDLIGEVALRRVTVRKQGNGSNYLLRGYQYVGRRRPLTTTLTPTEASRISGVSLPPDLPPETLLQAQLDVWHRLSGNEGDPSAINAYDSVNLTWGGGFAAAGQLQQLVRRLFDRSRDAMALFARVGMSVERVQGKDCFVVVDTTKRWKLVDKDAERYIRADRRLLSLLVRIADGTVPAGLFDGPGDVVVRNSALRSASLDAQFIVLIQNAGRLAAFALRPPWTPALRAAVAHNLHFGCITGGWARYSGTGGNPVEVVRAIVWSNGCGPTHILASAQDRFVGAFSHGALQVAAESFPEGPVVNDANARSIRVNGRVRVVARPGAAAPEAEMPSDELQPRSSPSVVGLHCPRFAGDRELEAVFSGHLRLGRPGTPALHTPVRSRGAAVQKVQRALPDLGYALPRYGPDGKFGLETGRAVSRFKKDRGVRPDDPVVGPKTIRALDRACPTGSRPTPVRPDAAVDKWQRLLGPTSRRGNDVVELIDGREAFQAMHDAIRTATTSDHFIFLLGWWLDLDEPMDLVRPAKPPAASATIRTLFTDAVRAGVQVRAMLWDQPGTKNSAEVRFINSLSNGAAILDNHQTAPNVGSHHQKMLVVKGTRGLVAFCGGVDINCDRVRSKAACRTPSVPSIPALSSGSSGSPAQPLHDVHCRVAGPATLDLRNVFVKRWFANKEHVKLDKLKGGLRGLADPRPAAVGRALVRVAETFNATASLPPGITGLRSGTIRFRNRGVQDVFLTAIANARRYIYIEEQYFVSMCAAEALRRALPSVRHVTVLMAASQIVDMPQVWARRKQVIDHIKTSPHASKFRVFTLCDPVSRTFPAHTYVHAKMLVADDEMAVIGSANLNRRGWEHDSEADAAIAGPARDGTPLAKRLRVRLWSEHLGVPAAVVDDPIASAARWTLPSTTKRVCPYVPTAGTDPIRHRFIPWDGLIDPPFALASAPCCLIHGPSCPGGTPVPSPAGTVRVAAANPRRVPVGIR